MNEPANAPPADRIADRLRAVVLDANSMSRGRIHLDRLRQWADELHSESIELWLPETVVWEWAEHSAADRAAATSTYEADRPSLLAAGFNLPEVEELSQEEATQVVIEAIQAVHGNIFIVEADGASARAALRDQILKLPPGDKIRTGDKRRPEVKTGAADSAAVRSIHAHAGSGAEYAVVTADNHWRETYEAQGWDVPLIYRSMRHLRRELFSIASADEAVPSVLSFMARSIAQRDGRMEVDSLTGGGRLSADLRADEQDEQEVNVTTVEVDLIQAVAGLEAVKLVEETGALLATVYLLADFHVTTMSIDPSGLFLLPRSRLIPDALVHGRMYLEVSDGIIMSARPESDPLIAVGPSEEYMEAEEAFFEALDALSTLPGLHDFDWAEAFEGKHSRSAELANNRVMELELKGSVFEDWELTVRAS